MCGKGGKVFKVPFLAETKHSLKGPCKIYFRKRPGKGLLTMVLDCGEARSSNGHVCASQFPWMSM